MKKLRQIFCKHETWHLPVDLDEFSDKETRELYCSVCGKKFSVLLTAYSAIQDIHRQYKCGKRRYGSKKEAETVMNRCMTKKRKVQPTRVYPCNICNSWHLTSNK